MKRKRHTGLITFLIILLIIIVLPIALVYILLYDNSTKEVKHKDGVTMSQYMETYKSRLLVDSIGNTKNDGKVSFTLGQDNINTLLYYGLNENLDKTVKQYVNKAYLDIDTNNKQYNIFVDASTPFFPYFKSRAQLVAEVNPLSTGLGFEIKFVDARVGRISGLLSLVKQYIPADMIKEVFSNTGLSFTVDWDNTKVTYDAKNMLKDLGLSGGSSDNLFMALVDEIFNNHQDLIGLDFYNKGGIDFSFDLSSAHTTTTSHISFTNTINKTRETYKSSTIENSDVLVDYFKETAENVTHEKPEAGKEVGDCFTDNKNELTKTTYVTETELNNYLRGTDLIGTVYPLYAQDEDTGNNIINFIVINDFYCNILEDNKVKFFINININDYATQMTVDATVANRITDKQGESGHFFNFTMDDISFGNKISMWDEDKDEPKAMISDLIKSGFTSENNDVTVNGKQIEIKVNSSDTSIDKMYSLTNEITTIKASGSEEAKVQIQIFTPNFKYGPGLPPSASEYAAVDGDMWLDTSVYKLYTFVGSSWNLGESILDPVWQSANPDKVKLLEDLDLFPTLP